MNIQASYVRNFGWYWTAVFFDGDPEPYYEEWYNTRELMAEAWKVDLDFIRAPVVVVLPAE